jgi:CYTH domain-containing protein
VKYARVEVERRFFLTGVPPGAVAPKQITDHYITDTQLRLRKVEEAGLPTVYKLGHKERPEPDDAVVVFHTTIYLTEAEYALLRGLPSQELRKTRYVVSCDGETAVVDEFHGALAGLVLLEVSFGDRSDGDRFASPTWAGVETTLTGGELAAMSAEDLRARLAPATSLPDSAH